jgi:hypothetical protein
MAMMRGMVAMTNTPKRVKTITSESNPPLAEQVISTTATAG